MIKLTIELPEGPGVDDTVGRITMAAVNVGARVTTHSDVVRGPDITAAVPAPTSLDIEPAFPPDPRISGEHPLPGPVEGPRKRGRAG